MYPRQSLVQPPPRTLMIEQTAPFQADVVAAVRGASLAVGLTINTGRAPFTFTGALHTYLRVSHIHDVVVKGLEGAGRLRPVPLCRSRGGGDTHSAPSGRTVVGSQVLTVE